MTRLGGVGRKIEKIVDAIALIAVQTSMLAVSGSVEAARAGESGRGFAIVSNDIRGLAREASANVERAKDTVRGVLEQIAVLKSDLEQIASSSRSRGREQPRRRRRCWRSSAARSPRCAPPTRASCSGAAEILAAAAETATGARQVAAASEEASAAAREAATAATEQSRGAEDLAAAIEEIASLADELKRADA